MSEVKRYTFKGAAGEYVYANDFDRVTAERDAALETVALKQRDLIEAQTAVTGWARKFDALQALLTAADERADVLEGRVSMLLRELQELINDDDGILVAAELCTGFVWHALQKHGKAIEAALKPAEGRGDDRPAAVKPSGNRRA